MLQIAVIAITMIILDAGWLWARGAASRTLIAGIQGSPLSIRLAPAALTYVVMVVGLWWFAVRSVTSWTAAATNGAALGAVVYGVYDLTNYSVLKGWPLDYALADWAWGTVLFGTTAAIATLVK